MKRRPRKKLVSFMRIDRSGRKRRVKFLAGTQKKRKMKLRGLDQLVPNKDEGVCRLVVSDYLSVDSPKIEYKLNRVGWNKAQDFARRNAEDTGNIHVVDLKCRNNSITLYACSRRHSKKTGSVIGSRCDLEKTTGSSESFDDRHYTHTPSIAGFDEE